MSSTPTHSIYWLHRHHQRLGLLPSLGGGMAAWQFERGGGLVNFLRPWDGLGTDRYRLGSFPLLPWSNRITAGGIQAQGKVYPIAPNRQGEPYPIHGDGWLQPWELLQTGPDSIEMHLQSQHFQGNPYHYRALQRFTLEEGGLRQWLEVTHLGPQPLPYGLGQHPCFTRRADTWLQAQVSGVWMCGDDPIPTHHRSEFPLDWDLPAGMPAMGSLIDNAYTGWDGAASIHWPHAGVALHMHCPAVQQGLSPGYCLVYRSPASDGFCLEPITHPIDAFHLPGQPGLVYLNAGQSLQLEVVWRIEQT